jgi:hypothetical protein
VSRWLKNFMRIVANPPESPVHVHLLENLPPTAQLGAVRHTDRIVEVQDVPLLNASFVFQMRSQFSKYAYRVRSRMTINGVELRAHGWILVPNRIDPAAIGF